MSRANWANRIPRECTVEYPAGGWCFCGCGRHYSVFDHSWNDTGEPWLPSQRDWLGFSDYKPKLLSSHDFRVASDRYINKLDKYYPRVDVATIWGDY